MRVPKRLQEQYEALLKNVGESKFYDHVLSTGRSATKYFEHPELEMLEQSEGFFSIFRTTGNRNMYVIGEVLRRAAHKIYRAAMQKDPTRPPDRRFINLIKK